MLVPKKTDRKRHIGIIYVHIKLKNRPFTNLHQPLHSCNGCNYHRKKLFNDTNYGSYRTQICLVSCSISTCFIKGKTSYGRHYHKFCSWRATISTILNNATAQYFPVATHAADTKQFKFNITCLFLSFFLSFFIYYPIYPFQLK